MIPKTLKTKKCFSVLAAVMLVTFGFSFASRGDDVVWSRIYNDYYKPWTISFRPNPPYYVYVMVDGEQIKFKKQQSIDIPPHSYIDVGFVMCARITTGRVIITGEGELDPGFHEGEYYGIYNYSANSYNDGAIQINDVQIPRCNEWIDLIPGVLHGSGALMGDVGSGIWIYEQKPTAMFGKKAVIRLGAGTFFDYSNFLYAHYPAPPIPDDIYN